MKKKSKIMILLTAIVLTVGMTAVPVMAKSSSYNGSCYFDGKKEIVLPALPVKAEDTTGAGDAFTGGLAAAISDGFDDETALRFAACTASLSVTRKGSSASMPYRTEIAALMRSAYGVEIV